jgi:uncharacterized OB-fold protein
VSARSLSLFGPDMPMPEPDPVTAPFWSAAREGRLVIQRCADCGAFRHLPHVLCPKCQSAACEWVASEGRGTVFTYTIVTHPVHPATASAVPYNVVLVELDDCGRVLVPGNVVDCPPEALQVGMPVRVVFDRVSEDVCIPRFVRS